MACIGVASRFCRSACRHGWLVTIITVNDQVIDYVGNDCIEANEESQVFQQMYTKYGIN